MNTRCLALLVLAFALAGPMSVYAQSTSAGEITGDKDFIHLNESFTLTISDSDLDTDELSFDSFSITFASGESSEQTLMAIRINNATFTVNTTISMNFQESGATDSGVFVENMNLSVINAAVPGGLTKDDIISFVYFDDVIVAVTERIFSM